MRSKRKNKVGRPATPGQLSPREARLVSFLKGDWIETEELLAKEFRKGVPRNGRMCVTVALRQARMKLKKNRALAYLIETRGGGRGGNEYRLVDKRA